MKTIQIITAVLFSLLLASCGVPVEFRVGYVDPEGGIDIDAGYSSKSGLSTGIDYTERR